ncbi:MAG: sulfurtransferase TusA family protein [Sphingomonadaceae bacterium]|nr:sulfurtransferase TusA family protein [Sphingomonadaceae bacterium]
MESQAVIHVDARGLRCPLPVLRLRKMAQGQAGLIELLSDDPAAEADVPAFVREKGWELVSRTVEGATTRWRIDLRNPTS